MKTEMLETEGKELEESTSWNARDWKNWWAMSWFRGWGWNQEGAAAFVKEAKEENTIYIKHKVECVFHRPRSLGH